MGRMVQTGLFLPQPINQQSSRLSRLVYLFNTIHITQQPTFWSSTFLPGFGRLL